MKKVTDLPEIDRLGDDGMVLCSQDEQHLSKIKRKHLTSNGGNGGLLYWKETEDKIYNERDVVPFNQDSVIVEIDDGFDGMYHQKHFEVFGKSFPYVVEEPNGRQRALNQARSYGIVSTDGYVGHLPSGYVFTPSDNTFNYEYRYEDIMNHDTDTWSHTSTMDVIYSPGLSASRTNFMGYITLHCENHVGDIWKGVEQPWHWGGAWANYADNHANQRTSREVDEYNTFECNSKFLFLLTCTNYVENEQETIGTGINNSVSYRVMGWNSLAGKVEQILATEIFGAWTRKYDGRHVDNIIIDRSPGNTCYFTDENSILWILTVLPVSWDIDARGVSQYEIKLPDFERDFDELSVLDLGDLYDHWSYYNGADPVDETTGYGNDVINEETRAKYSHRMAELGKTIMSALGVRTYKGILPDEIPEDMSYKTRASMQVTDDFTAFSAGLVDSNGVYEEKFKVDAKNGDVYEDGQKLSDKYIAIGTPVSAELPYSTTPQKIGTWLDGRDVYRVVYYLKSDSVLTTTKFYLVPSLTPTDGYAIQDAVIVNSSVYYKTTATSTVFLIFPASGSSSSSYGTSYGNRYLTEFSNNGDGTYALDVRIVKPTYGAYNFSFYTFVAVVDYVI